MKNKNIIYLVLLLTLWGAKPAFSACPTVTPETAILSNLKDIFTNYSCFPDPSTNEYVLDFSKNTTPFLIFSGVSFNLNNTSDKNVRIIGLNFQLKEGKPPSSLYLTLLGSKIIVESSTFASLASDTLQGTAIQIGDDINPTSGITIGVGVNNTFTNFATGINVAQNAGAKITQNIFTNVATPIAYESSLAMAMSADWFGKHIRAPLKTPFMASLSNHENCNTLIYNGSSFDRLRTNGQFIGF